MRLLPFSSCGSLRNDVEQTASPKRKKEGLFLIMDEKEYLCKDYENKEISVY